MNLIQAKHLREEITRTLNECGTGLLAPSTIALLGALGYHSDRTLALTPNSFITFQETFAEGKTLDTDKALASQWKSVDLLFQYTDAEVKSSGQMALDVFADPRFDPGVYQAFVFLAIDLAANLDDKPFTRTQLAEATREINKLFLMPAIIVFRHGATLTLAVIERRLNKRDGNKDVLEKVTLIKDIRCVSPHRAHVEILSDLALDNLLEHHSITNFDTLHIAWRKTLDTAVLNKKFYKELADWYFWALKHVTFPPQAGVAADVNAATNAIRLITRLMFTWFLKERGLVPEELFNEDKLKTILTDLSPDSSTYYKAILQNLFFATLNTEMDDPIHPRRFRGRNQGRGQDSHYGIPNVLRYDSSFHDTGTALALFAPIPFLNGGLFECLDQTPQGAPRILVDGFSDREDNPLQVPNYLFFSEEQTIDLNTVYGTTGKITKVRGLLTILHSFKFTVAENTPIEEEIALDPELLGRVFENLLASYNPETGATARKQTGSFYTPREIVNYMVDEALIASLETALTPSPAISGSPPPQAGEGIGVGADLNTRLRHLFAYNPEPPQFSAAETDTLITAIDSLKILDPACGSGAFPMGILQKLVFVLSKLDPQNAQWRLRQITKAEQIDEPAARDHAIADIEQAFAKNDLNYGRKLYLISNGIYGVDIQPIAMQIAKLRFFISLVIDQRIDNNAPNKGVRALPNLETKFVAANTLIGIDKPVQGSFDKLAIDEKEKQLKAVRERHFSARTTAAKNKCREDDKRLRGEICALLEMGNWPHDKAMLLASWNPYDQNQSADFFDPEWMYGITSGFDIVIANPPYGFRNVLSSAEKLFFRKVLKIDFPTGDVAELFIIICFAKLLKDIGTLTYIIPKKSLYGEAWNKIRKLWQENDLRFLMDASKAFDNVLLEQVAFLIQKQEPIGKLVSVGGLDATTNTISTYGQFAVQEIFTDDLRNAQIYKGLYPVGLMQKIEASKVDDTAEIFKAEIGLTNITPFLTLEAKNNYPCVKGIDVVGYGLKTERRYLKSDVAEKHKEKYKGAKLVAQEIIAHVMNPVPHIKITIFYDDQERMLNDTCVEIKVLDKSVDPKFLLGYLQSTFCNWYCYHLIYNRAIRTMHFINYYATQIPFPKRVIVNKHEQAGVIALVNQMTKLRELDPKSNIKHLQEALDEEVFKLYDLNSEEVSIIRSEASISEDSLTDSSPDFGD